MDTSDPDILFDDAGYCNHCIEFYATTIKKTYRGLESDKQLQKEILHIKKLGLASKYDCIVGISGGVDSCYTAYMCKKLGLRILLVHVDNGWNSEVSVKNIEVVCRNLELDYISRVLDWKEFSTVQYAYLRASVPEIETPTDIAILEELHKVAAEYNTKYIVMGGNYITEGILPKAWHYNPKDKKYAYNIYKKFRRQVVKNFPSFDFPKEIYYKFFKGIKIFYLLNYIHFDKPSAIATLENIGWKRYGEKHHESFYTRLVQSYILPKKFNIDYRKAIVSIKICTGQMKREEAISMLSIQPYSELTIEEDIAYFCKKLEINRSTFDSIMNERPKSYLEYPNNQFLLEFLYKLYQKIIRT